MKIKQMKIAGEAMSSWHRHEQQKSIQFNSSNSLCATINNSLFHAFDTNNTFIVSTFDTFNDTEMLLNNWLEVE